MPEISVYTVPNCAAVTALLKRYGAAFTEQNVRGAPEALAELRRANVQISPVTLIGDQVFYGSFDEVSPRLMGALASFGASQHGESA